MGAASMIARAVKWRQRKLARSPTRLERRARRLATGLFIVCTHVEGKLWPTLEPEISCSDPRGCQFASLVAERLYITYEERAQQPIHDMP